ncbi:hypothetical protein [Synechococcus sp. C9]|nr:hypothetical protein [Synechococcus sp. C9]
MATTKRTKKTQPAQESKTPMPKPQQQPATDWRQIIQRFEW